MSASSIEEAPGMDLLDAIAQATQDLAGEDDPVLIVIGPYGENELRASLTENDWASLASALGLKGDPPPPPNALLKWRHIIVCSKEAVP